MTLFDIIITTAIINNSFCSWRKKLSCNLPRNNWKSFYYSVL